MLSGSSIAFGEPGDAMQAYARNIRPDDTDGIGLWNIDQFTAAVTAGIRPDSAVLAPQMPYSHFKFLNEDEVTAAYLFLKSLEPMKRTVPAPSFASDFTSMPHGLARGRMLFNARCKTCHGVEGTGARPTNVKLAEVAPSLEDAELMEFIASGQPNLKMPPFGRTLAREDLADLVAYIRSWKGR